MLRLASMALREKGSAREMTETRCDRGADIASMLGFTEATRKAIRTLDEHWDGSGMPEGLAGAAIPLLGRIVGLAQSVEVFASDEVASDGKSKPRGMTPITIGRTSPSAMR